MTRSAVATTADRSMERCSQQPLNRHVMSRTRPARGARLRRARPTGVMDRSADALDSLAGTLRDRLVDAAGEAADGDDPAARIGALVEREAGVLDAATRDELAARVAERAVGLGPLEPLLRDRTVDEIMVCG